MSSGVLDLGASTCCDSQSSTRVVTDFFDTDLVTGVGDLVVLTGTYFVSRIVDNATASMPNGIFGVVLDKPTSVRAEVMFLGIKDGYLGFTPGLALFVSTSGVPTHAVAATGMVQQIGFAVSPTAFHINLKQPMRRS